MIMVRLCRPVSGPISGRKPLPIFLKLVGRPPTVAPSRTTSVRPRKSSMLDSVTMNAGIPTYATQKPCQAPIAAPRMRHSTTARNHGTSCLVIRIAQTAPTNAATEPTDRSMWRATITITMPMARIRIWAFWTTRLETLIGLSSTPSVVIWNRMTIAARAMIMPYWRMLPRSIVSSPVMVSLPRVHGHVAHERLLGGLRAGELFGDHALGEGVDAVTQAEQLGELG